MRNGEFDAFAAATNADYNSETDYAEGQAVANDGQPVARTVLDKVFRILKHFPGGKKRDLEKYGRYVMQLLRTRTSSEVPKALSSRFMPEHEAGQSPMDKLTQDPVYQAAMRGQGQEETGDSSLKDKKRNASSEGEEGGMLKGMPHLARLARAHAEDTRHKLYQMTWTPESTIAYVAHRFPAVYASNFRKESGREFQL